MHDDAEQTILERELGGRYQIVRVLGRGASGAVYLARERQLHRMVAIKVLRAEHVWSEAERARLRQEARTVANLSHPGIIPLLAFEETERSAYMVMPYIGGETLADRLERDQRIPPEETRACLAELAAALGYAHREGVVHRDLKPENVLLVSDGERTRPVLMDFGIAAFPSRDLGVGGMREHAGTMHFMSPEQALGETELDGRSDLFALGALGYLMLAGSVPFDGPSRAAIIARICAGERVPLKVAAPEAPADLAAAIDKCLETNPTERWRRASGLREALGGGAVMSASGPHALFRRALRGRRESGRGTTWHSRGRAHRRARGSERVAAEMRAARTSRIPRALAGLSGDLRFAARTLRKTPGFTAAVILTLALGLAATTVVFSAVEALLLRKLPVTDPASLVVLQEHRERMNVNHRFDVSTFRYDRYLAYRKATTSVFTDLGAQSPKAFSVRSGDAARMVGGLVTSGNYFALLGVHPALGRFYTAAEDQPTGAPPVVVVGYDFWKRTLGGTPTAVGQTLWLNSRPLTVIGVAPAGFNGAFASAYVPIDLWMPAAEYQEPSSPSSDSASATPDYEWMNLFGRLRPGVDIASASAALHVIGPRVPPVDPRTQLLDAWAEPLGAISPANRSSAERFLSMLFAAAGLVLLIAITNAAGMLLARAAARGREVATRLAVGATRGRLVRQLLVECALLCVAAGGVALLLTWCLLRLLNASSSVNLGGPTAIEFGLNHTVLIVAVAFVGGAALLSGLVPAMHATRMELSAAMKEGGLRGGTRRTRLRSTFVIAQVMLSVVLLTVAGLFVRSLRQMLAIDPGFEAAGVVHAYVSVGRQGYDEERARVLFTQLLAQLRARPEVAAASFANLAPLRGGYSRSPATVPGRPDDENVSVQWGFAGSGFIELLRTPLLAGRTFTEADEQNATLVTVINQTLAQQLWPGETPREVVGREMEKGSHTFTVVGVMANGKYGTLQEASRSFAYLPFTLGGTLSGDLYVRARGSVAAAAVAMREELARLDPNVALQQPMLLTDDVAQYSSPQRIGVLLVGTFGLVGLILAMTGVYGVLAFGVTQRQREFGVRIALGAQVRDVVRLVVRHGLTLVAVGIALGLIGTLVAARLVSGFLYHVSPADPLTLVAVPLVLLAVALLASIIPARRAAAADPMASLRAE